MALSLIFAACEKEEDETGFEKSQLLGKWVKVNPAPEDATCSDYNEFIEFSDTQISSGTACDGAESSMSMDYTFDGEKITYQLFFTVNMKVVELTDTKLVTDESVQGVNASERITYDRAE